MKGSFDLLSSVLLGGFFLVTPFHLSGVYISVLIDRDSLRARSVKTIR